MQVEGQNVWVRHKSMQKGITRKHSFNSSLFQKCVLSFDPDAEDEEDYDSEEEKSGPSHINESASVDETSRCSTTSSADNEPFLKKFKIGKDPTVDTSFLPDKEREEEENK